MVRTYSDFEESWASGGPLLGSRESRQGSHVESTQTQGAEAVTDKIHWPIKWRLEVLSFCSSKMVKNGRMETLPLNPTLGLKLERLDLVDFHLHCQQVKKVSLSDTPSLSPISSLLLSFRCLFSFQPRRNLILQLRCHVKQLGSNASEWLSSQERAIVKLLKHPNFVSAAPPTSQLLKFLTYKKSLQYHILLRFLSPPSTPKKEQHYVAMFVILTLYTNIHKNW